MGCAGSRDTSAISIGIGQAMVKGSLEADWLTAVIRNNVMYDSLRLGATSLFFTPKLISQLATEHDESEMVARQMDFTTSEATLVNHAATGPSSHDATTRLAILFVRLGFHVHVLKHDATELRRDFTQSKPLYDSLGISAGAGLELRSQHCSHDESTDPKIVYCLIDGINRRFLRKLVEGHLDEFERTILIVDEAEDVLINDAPNNMFSRRDAQRSAEMVKAYEAVQKGGETPEMPEGVALETWEYALAVRDYCAKDVVEGTHYRVFKNEGKERVIMLDEHGNVPNVSLTSPWLIYLNYKLFGIEPFSETRHACVCTSYMFKRYKGVMSLCSAALSPAEHRFLSKSYSLLQYQAPQANGHPLLREARQRGSVQR